MVWILFAVASLGYLLLWPFCIRMSLRLSATSCRGEVYIASFFRLRIEGDFLQEPYFSLHLLDGRGRRKKLTSQGKGQGFTPIIQVERLDGALYLGVREEGAFTVEALGALYALLETAGLSLNCRVNLQPRACFDKNICALQLFGIGRFTLAQNIKEYLKEKRRYHAIR